PGRRTAGGRRGVRYRRAHLGPGAPRTAHPPDHLLTGGSDAAPGRAIPGGRPRGGPARALGRIRRPALVAGGRAAAVRRARDRRPDARPRTVALSGPVPRARPGLPVPPGDR